VYAGFQMYAELTDFDLTELFGIGRGFGNIFGFNGYLETELTLGEQIEVRPGVVLAAAPRGGAEPRIRASWEPAAPLESCKGRSASAART